MRVLRDLHDLIETVQAKRVASICKNYGVDVFEFKFRRSFRWLLFVCDAGLALILREDLSVNHACFNDNVGVASIEFCASFLEVFELYSNNVHVDVDCYRGMISHLEKPEASFSRWKEEGYDVISLVRKPNFPELKIRSRDRRPWCRKLCATGPALAILDTLLLGDNSYVALSPSGGDARMVFHVAIAQICALYIDVREYLKLVRYM